MTNEGRNERVNETDGGAEERKEGRRVKFCLQMHLKQDTMPSPIPGTLDSFSYRPLAHNNINTHVKKWGNSACVCVCKQTLTAQLSIRHLGGCSKDMR